MNVCLLAILVGQATDNIDQDQHALPGRSRTHALMFRIDLCALRLSIGGGEPPASNQADAVRMLRPVMAMPLGLLVLVTGTAGRQPAMLAFSAPQDWFFV